MLNLEQATGERNPADALHKFANTVSSVEQEKAAWRLRWFRQRSGRRPPARRHEGAALSSLCSSTRSLGLRTRQRSGAQALEAHTHVANLSTDAAHDEMMLNAVPSSSSTAAPAQAGAASARSSMHGSHKSFGLADEEFQKTNLRRFHREARRQEPLLQELKSMQEQVKKQMPMSQAKKQLLSSLQDRFRKASSAGHKEDELIKRCQSHESPPVSPHGSIMLSPTTSVSEFMRNRQASPQGPSALEAWDPEKYLRDLEELELLEEQDEALDQARNARAKARRPVAAFLAAVESEDCDVDHLFHLPKRGSKAKTWLEFQSTVGTHPAPGSSNSSSQKVTSIPLPVPPPPRTDGGGGRRSTARDPVPSASPPVPRDPPPKMAGHPEKGVCSSSQPGLRGEVRRVFSRGIMQGRAKPAQSPVGVEPAKGAGSLAASCLRSRARNSVDVPLAELSILPMKVDAAPAQRPRAKRHGSPMGSDASSPSPRPRRSSRASRFGGASNADTDVDPSLSVQLRRRFSISAEENKQMVQQRSSLFRPSSKHR
jgi:hypothetical protein